MSARPTSRGLAPATGASALQSSTGGVSDTATPGVDLQALLVNTDGWDQARLNAEARKLFDSHCRTPASLGMARTHDDLPVKMYDDVVPHAFQSARSRYRRGWAKDDWDARRVARVRWILPVIGGFVDGTDCYLVTDHASPDHPKPQQRLYIVKRIPYIVYLGAKTSGWVFNTAYVAGFDDVKRYISAKKGQDGQTYPAPKLIWGRP